MPNKLISLAFLCLLILSCNNQNETKQANTTTEQNNIVNTNKLNRFEQQQIIYDAEQELYKKKDKPFDEAAALSVLNIYYNYIENFPEDTINAHYLFKAAQLQITLKQPEQAIRNLNSLINKYPSFYKIAEAYYLKAYAYDAGLNDAENAQKAYKDFINKFPKHPLTQSAKNNLSIAGKSEKELLKFIHSKNK